MRLQFFGNNIGKIFMSLFSFFVCGVDPGGGGGSQQGDEGSRMGAAIYAGAAAAGVLLIIGMIVIIVLWRRRKPSSDGNSEIFPHYLIMYLPWDLYSDLTA